MDNIYLLFFGYYWTIINFLGNCCCINFKKLESNPQVSSETVLQPEKSVDQSKNDNINQNNNPNFHVDLISVKSVHIESVDSFRESVGRFKEGVVDFNRISHPIASEIVLSPAQRRSTKYSEGDQEYNTDFRILSKVLNMESFVDEDMSEIERMSEDDIKNIVDIYSKMQCECSDNLRKLCNGIISTEDILRNIQGDDVLIQLINIYSLVLTKCVMCITSLSSNSDINISLNENLINTVSLYSEFLDKTMIIIDNICSDNNKFSEMDITHKDTSKEAMLEFIRVSNIHQSRYKFVLDELDVNDVRM